MTNAHGRALVGTPQLLGGIVAGRILPTKQTQNNSHWLTICRAWRSDRDQHLLNLHRQRLTAHLGNVVFLGGR